MHAAKRFLDGLVNVSIATESELLAELWIIAANFFEVTIEKARGSQENLFAGGFAGRVFTCKRLRE